MSRGRLAAVAVGAAVMSAAVFAGSATAQNTTKSSSTNSCPSQQTVMTSTSSYSTSGYLCAQEYHSGNNSISAGEPQVFSEATNALYYPQYYCWDSSDDKEMSYTKLLTMGSGTVTATSTGNHVWGAGFLFTLEGGTVTGWTNGCYDNSQVWENPPDLLRMTSITASGLPDNGVATAGALYTIKTTVAPANVAVGGTVALEDNGVAVAQGAATIDSTGAATISWRPAQMGSHKIQVAWPGQDGVLGNITDSYTVNVSGGMAVGINPTMPSAGGGSYTATVNLDSTPGSFPASTVLVTLKNLSSGKAVGQATVTAPASGSTASANVTVQAAPGTTYPMVAVVTDSTGKTIYGQSYKTNVSSPPTITASFPASVSNVCTNPLPTVPVTITPTTATGTVTVSGEYPVDTVLSGGQANAAFCAPQTPGPANITVSYSGDANYPASSVTIPVTITQGAPSLYIGSVATNSNGQQQAKVNTSAMTDGTVVTVTNGGTTTLGSAAMSGGVAKVPLGTLRTGVEYVLVASATYGGKTYSSNGYIYMKQSNERIPAGAAQMERGSTRTQPGAKAETAKKPKPRRNGKRAGTPPSVVRVATGATTITRSTTVTNSRRSVKITCPKGAYPLHAQGLTSGPDTGYSVSFSGRTARLTTSSANVGKRLTSQVTCRQSWGAAMMAYDVLGYGTRGNDSLASVKPSSVAFGGPGNDRIALRGAGSSAWGGLGRDRIVVAGGRSVAAGGPGPDRLVANGAGKITLWAGEGRDTMVGGTGATTMNARDGKGGDRLVCRSSANKVMLDAGDITSGPCTVINP